MKNKKAQFGPDFIIGLVLVILVGLGGVLFLHLYVSGLSMQGLLSVLDTEADQKCFNILIATVGDEYVNIGEDVTGLLYFEDLFNYYGGEQPGAFKSLRFEEKMEEFEEVTTMHFRPMDIKSMHYYLASKRNARVLRDEYLGTDPAPVFTHFCSIPIYGPHEPGFAELFMNIEE